MVGLNAAFNAKSSIQVLCSSESCFCAITLLGLGVAREGVQNLHPTNIRIIEKIFSLSVFGATFPNPTEMRPVKQKQSEVKHIKAIEKY